MFSVFVNVLPGLTRIAVTREDRLERLVYDRGQSGNRGDIYLGQVTKVLPGIDAAFIDLGDGREAFLEGRGLPASIRGKGRAPIDSVLKQGRRLMVQITKPAWRDKAAQVSAEIKLVGFSIIAVLGSGELAYSRDLSDDFDHEGLAEALPPGGWVVRAGAASLEREQVVAEAALLKEQADSLTDAASRGGNRLLLARPPLLDVLCDGFKQGVRSIFIDEDDLLQQWREHLSRQNPRLCLVLRAHGGSVPLFNLFKIESEIEKALSPKVWLRSGGHLLFHHGDALTAVDVNTAKTKKRGAESTVMKTNLEAVNEICRQIRLRNLAGLIVIDFVNCREKGWQQRLDGALRKAFRSDSRAVDLLCVDKLGLVRLSRERLGLSLHDQLMERCGTCRGTGFVPSLTAVIAELGRKTLMEAAGLEDEVLVLVCGRQLAKAMKKRKILVDLQTRTGCRLLLREDASLGLRDWRIDMEEEPDQGTDSASAPVYS